MEVIKQYKISSNSELIFAKNDLKNFFKHISFEDSSFFLFALMELGTNILKYPKEGEIWILKENNNFLIAALDKGKGIEDINWALKKGSSSKNTLGLGLYQLSQNNKYKLEILSLNDKHIHGSIILIRPKEDEKFTYLIRNYFDLPYGGDFVLRKGKYIILGDISGHGIKAYESIKYIKNFFLKKVFSCLIIDEFLKSLSEKLKKQKLRGFVVTILEIINNKINVCGIGSNKMYVKKEGNIEVFSFKEGIIGEVFFNSTKYEILDFDCVFVTTDGVNEKIMYNVLTKTNSLYLIVLAGIYFSDVSDDKSIIGVKNGL